MCTCVYVYWGGGGVEELKGEGFDFVFKVLGRCINRVLSGFFFRFIWLKM